MDEVDAKREVGFRIAEQTKNGGQDVDLLCHRRAHAWLHQRATGVEDDDRRTEQSDVGHVFRVVALVGVVAGEHEERVAIPRLTAGLAEEAAQRHIGIADALVDGQLLFLIDIAVLLGNLERMMRRRCEDGRHERLLQLRHLRAVVLQERLVPDAPVAVEVGIAAKAAVGSIVLAAVVLLEAGLVGKRHETHRPAVGTVEEGCLIAFAGQQSCNAGVGVHRCRREHKRLNEHRNATKHGWHSVDALAAVAERMFEDKASGNNRVDVRRVALIASPFQIFVQCTDIFAPEALDDEYHHIALPDAVGRDGGRLRLMNGRIDFRCLVEVGIPRRHDEHALSDGANQGEGRVEHHCTLRGVVDILIGVVDGDRPNAVSQPAATAANAQWNGDEQSQEHHPCIDPLLRPLLEIVFQDARRGIEFP